MANKNYLEKWILNSTQIVHRSWRLKFIKTPGEESLIAKRSEGMRFLALPNKRIYKNLRLNECFICILFKSRKAAEHNFCRNNPSLQIRLGAQRGLTTRLLGESFFLSAV